MNITIALGIIGAVVGIAGYLLNRQSYDQNIRTYEHTEQLEKQTDRAVYAALLSRLTLLCRESAIQVNTATQCLWVKVDGVGRSFRFYTSANPSCSSEDTILVNFLHDYESIEMIIPNEKPRTMGARLIGAEVDKFLADSRYACVGN